MKTIASYSNHQKAKLTIAKENRIFFYLFVSVKLCMRPWGSFMVQVRIQRLNNFWWHFHVVWNEQRHLLLFGLVLFWFPFSFEDSCCFGLYCISFVARARVTQYNIFAYQDKKMGLSKENEHFIFALSAADYNLAYYILFIGYNEHAEGLIKIISYCQTNDEVQYHNDDYLIRNKSINGYSVSTIFMK